MSRRGSSLFTQGGGPAAAAPQESAPGGNAKRASVVLQPMAGGIGFDYDSSEHEQEQTPKQPMAHNPGAAPGGPNHRPMVGGFAAAAYEAARAHHYALKNKKKNQSAMPQRSSGRPHP